MYLVVCKIKEITFGLYANKKLNDRKNFWSFFQFKTNECDWSTCHTIASELYFPKWFGGNYIRKIPTVHLLFRAKQNHTKRCVNNSSYLVSIFKKSLISIWFVWSTCRNEIIYSRLIWTLYGLLYGSLYGSWLKICQISLIIIADNFQCRQDNFTSFYINEMCQHKNTTQTHWNYLSDDHDWSWFYWTNRNQYFVNKTEISVK